MCKCVYKKCGNEESSFFLSWKKVAFLKANARYFYRFVIICVFLRCFLVIEKQLYLKSSIQIYILLLLCLFRDSSLARYGHLSSLSFLSLTLSLSLSLSLLFLLLLLRKKRTRIVVSREVQRIRVRGNKHFVTHLPPPH